MNVIMDMLQQSRGGDPQTAQAAQKAAEQAAQAAQQAADAAIEASGQSGAHFNREQFRTQLRNNIRDAIRGGDAGAFESQDPTAPLPPASPRYSSSQVPRELIVAIRDTTPRVVSMLGITLVCCVVGFPIARAFARWIDRRGAPAAKLPSDLGNRLIAIEQAVESIAVEVERISEGQRFTARVLTERTHEPAQDFAAGRRDRDAVPVGASSMSSKS